MDADADRRPTEGAHDGRTGRGGDELALRDVTALPVLRDGAMVGMFTEENLLAATSSTPRQRLAVGDVMGPVLLTTTPDADREQLAAVMAARNIHSVPVLDHGRLVGIITRRDLLPRP
jgi:CBS domain-containing protein